MNDNAPSEVITEPQTPEAIRRMLADAAADRVEEAIEGERRALYAKAYVAGIGRAAGTTNVAAVTKFAKDVATAAIEAFDDEFFPEEDGPDDGPEG